MKPMKNLLLMGLLSALGAGGALAGPGAAKLDPGDGANRGESPARLRAVGAAGV